MTRQPVTVSLEESLWIKFKQYCIGRKVDASDLFEKFMQRVLKNTQFTEPKKAEEKRG